MLLYQHLMYGGILSVGVVLLAYVLFGRRGLLPAFVVFLGVFLTQLLDVDHYIGDWGKLFSCAIKTTVEGYRSTPYCLALERGVFHQFRVGAGLFALLVGWIVHNRKEKIRVVDVFFLSAASICLMIAVFQQVFPYVLAYFVGALFFSKYVIRTRSVYYGSLVAGLLFGWALHTHLDLLLNFWFGQVL